MECESVSSDVNEVQFTYFQSQFGLPTTSLNYNLVRFRRFCIRLLTPSMFLIIVPTVSQLRLIPNLPMGIVTTVGIVICIWFVVAITPEILVSQSFWLRTRLWSVIKRGNVWAISTTATSKREPSLIRFSPSNRLIRWFLILPAGLILGFPHLMFVMSGVRQWWDLPIGILVAVASLLIMPPTFEGQPVAAVVSNNSIRLYFRSGHFTLMVDDEIWVEEYVSLGFQQIQLTNRKAYLMFEGAVSSVFPQVGCSSSFVQILRRITEEAKTQV